MAGEQLVPRLAPLAPGPVGVLGPADVRGAQDPDRAWRQWREARDELFARHPQSPLPEWERSRFNGLPYFDYDDRYRVLADVVAADPETYDIATSGEEGGSYRFTRFAVARFA